MKIVRNEGFIRFPYGWITFPCFIVSSRDNRSIVLAYLRSSIFKLIAPTLRAERGNYAPRAKQHPICVKTFFEAGCRKNRMDYKKCTREEKRRIVWRKKRMNLCGKENCKVIDIVHFSLTKCYQMYGTDKSVLFALFYCKNIKRIKLYIHIIYRVSRTTVTSGNGR